MAGDSTDFKIVPQKHCPCWFSTVQLIMVATSYMWPFTFEANFLNVQHCFSVSLATCQVLSSHKWPVASLCWTAQGKKPSPVKFLSYRSGLEYIMCRVIWTSHKKEIFNQIYVNLGAVSRGSNPSAILHWFISCEILTPLLLWKNIILSEKLKFIS